MLPIEKREALVWEELKALFDRMGEPYFVGDIMQYFIGIKMEMMENTHPVSMNYYIHSKKVWFRSEVVSNFPERMVTDIFILASHLNNQLENGIVKVDVKEKKVIYLLSRTALLGLLYSRELNDQFSTHFFNTRDIWCAFHRLLDEGEEPAVIIGDFLRYSSLS